uniref:ABC transporter B family member 9-like n=1 Tax=Nicotiana sylvestris TaxID=4096 RepID=A0A1U7VTY0_NICSY|nr:PREDICTED: ABC transporter B family member 9-like [Nicotiana sylvestris]
MAKGGEPSSARRKEEEDDQKIPFYMLFAFADRTDVILMLFGTLGAIASGISKPLMSLIFGDLVNSYGKSNQSNILDQVSGISLKFVYLAIGSGIASVSQIACWVVTGERQATRIKCLYLKTILRQDIGFFDTQSATGEFIERMSGDTILVQEAMGDKVANFIMNISTFIGGFVVAFIKGWLLTLVLLTSIPATAISFGCVALVLSKMSGSGQVAYADAGKVVEQTVGGIRTVASFTGEKLAIEDYNSKLESAYSATVKQALASGLGLGTILTLIFFSYGLAIRYGAKLIIEKDYKGGDIISVIFAVMLGGSSLRQASPSLNAFSAGQAAAYKIFETIKRKPKIDPYDPRGIQLEDIIGEIELKDVYFKYPARPDVQIFSGLSLYIPSGKTAALVGQSGSGKSTVISLLERFYDPEAGEILIDGVDIKKFQLKWLRQQMGLVSQEPVLFATTIRENIIYGKENASEEEIRNAIHLANAAKFIDKLPKVASFTGEKLAIEDYNSKLESAYSATVKQALASGLGLGTILTLIFFSYGLAIRYGAKLIIEKDYKGGDIISVIFAVMLGGRFHSLRQASPSLNAFSAGQAAAYKIFETIKRKPKIDPYDPRGIQLEDIIGEIELKDVYFKYPARPDVQIFSGLSLYIPSGKTAALVGQSGSGKSTVISLLERFYDPEAGEILIDGVDIKKFQLKWLRQQMGLVSQEPVLFATTIRENIIYGKENASEEEIRNAIHLANAAKFIDKLPKGLDTMVGGHGTQISGDKSKESPSRGPF